ncbi:MAG: hypothetical protein DDT21_02414 [Syntrophomonadaceae bacterium]|nr:hypothetical protein [Bacillota bacterium]
MTGSGKSRLLTRLAGAYSRALIVDPKDDPEAMLPNAAVVYDALSAVRALPGRVIYRPRRADMAQLGAHVDRVLDRIWSLGGGHAVILHELGDLAGADRVPPVLAECYRKGRSRGIPMLAATQRPVDIPRVAISEASHIFAFALMDQRDRDTLAAYMGDQVRAGLPFTHSFWYRGPDYRLIRCSPLR